VTVIVFIKSCCFFFLLHRGYRDTWSGEFEPRIKDFSTLLPNFTKRTFALLQAIEKNPFFKEIYYMKLIRKQPLIIDINKVPEEVLCVVCTCNLINVLSFPCGHFVLCDKCAENIESCCFCRTKITEQYVLK